MSKLNLAVLIGGEWRTGFDAYPYISYYLEKIKNSDLKIIKPTMSLAGVESTITSPALSSHKKMDPDIRRGLGISDNLLRFSVGIEDFEDLMLDLDNALTKNGK